MNLMKSKRLGKMVIGAFFGATALSGCQGQDYMEGRVIQELESVDPLVGKRYKLVVETPERFYTINVMNSLYSKPLEEFATDVQVGDSVIFPLHDTIDNSRLFDRNGHGSLPVSRIIVKKKPFSILKNTSQLPQQYPLQ